MQNIFRRAVMLCVLAGLGAVGLPAGAQAWWHGGPRWYGGVYVAPPPVYVAPPPLYAVPPPPVYVPPGYVPAAPYVGGAPVAAGACYAQGYVCPLLAPTQQGAACACYAGQGAIWGQAR